MSTLNSLNTIDELKQHFVTKLEALQKAVNLTYSLKDHEVKRLHDESHLELDALVDILDKMEVERQKKRMLLERSEKLMQTVTEVNRIVDSTSSVQTRNVSAPMRMSFKDAEEHKAKKLSFNEYMEEYDNEPGYSRELRSSLSKDEVKIHPTFLLVTEMNHLTESDLSRVPKYAKGRLTLEKINLTVDALNQACSSKYEILRTPKSKQTDRIRTAIRNYKDQENKDTEGFNFIIDKDMLAFTSIKLDKSFHSIITVLRCSGRVKEARGNNLLRYILLGTI